MAKNELWFYSGVRYAKDGRYACYCDTPAKKRTVLLKNALVTLSRANGAVNEATPWNIRQTEIRLKWLDASAINARAFMNSNYMIVHDMATGVYYCYYVDYIDTVQQFTDYNDGAIANIENIGSEVIYRIGISLDYWQTFFFKMQNKFTTAYDKPVYAAPHSSVSDTVNEVVMPTLGGKVLRCGTIVKNDDGNQAPIAFDYRERKTDGYQNLEWVLPYFGSPNIFYLAIEYYLDLSKTNPNTNFDKPDAPPAFRYHNLAILGQEFKLSDSYFYPTIGVSYNLGSNAGRSALKSALEKITGAQSLIVCTANNDEQPVEIPTHIVAFHLLPYNEYKQWGVTSIRRIGALLKINNKTAGNNILKLASIPDSNIEFDMITTSGEIGTERLFFLAGGTINTSAGLRMSGILTPPTGASAETLTYKEKSIKVRMEMRPYSRFRASVKAENVFNGNEWSVQEGGLEIKYFSLPFDYISGGYGLKDTSEVESNEKNTRALNIIGGAISFGLGAASGNAGALLLGGAKFAQSLSGNQAAESRLALQKQNPTNTEIPTAGFGDPNLLDLLFLGTSIYTLGIKCARSPEYAENGYLKDIEFGGFLVNSNYTNDIFAAIQWDTPIIPNIETIYVEAYVTKTDSLFRECESCIKNLTEGMYFYYV